jgi:hypothetical protein
MRGLNPHFAVGQPFQADGARGNVILESLTYAAICMTRRNRSGTMEGVNRPFVPQADSSISE